MSSEAASLNAVLFIHGSQNRAGPLSYFFPNFLQLLSVNTNALSTKESFTTNLIERAALQRTERASLDTIGVCKTFTQGNQPQREIQAIPLTCLSMTRMPSCH